MILIETCLSALVVAVALLWPGLGSKWFEVTERKLGALARRRRATVLLVGICALAARAAVLPILPVPQPRVDDEFSYILAGDTFARGRLTNPTPPMWRHFQTLAELVRPSYQSITPPAQGLVLALGRVLFGGAFWGVWLSVGAMCAAICWMLQAWVGPEWALLGGFLAVARFGIFGYWADSYWGGAVAAVGGALVLGALPRIFETSRPRHAVLLGLGLAILANSRPYEGLVFALPVAAAFLGWLAKKRGDALWGAMRRSFLPLVGVLLVTGAATSYYFWRVTGDPFLMPHWLYNRTFDPVPPFLGLPLGKMPAIRNPPMRHVLLRDQVFLFRESRSPVGLLAVWIIKAARMWPFFLGPILTLPFFLLPFALPRRWRLGLRDWRKKFLLWASLISFVGVAMELYGFPHYAAPMTCLVLAVVLSAMGTVRQWQPWGRPTGAFVVRGTVVVCMAMLVTRAAAGPLGIPFKPTTILAWYSSNPKTPLISRVRAEVGAVPGKQLVFVRYSPGFWKNVPGLNEPHEWAWNSPDIASQRVVWADDLGPEEDGALISYFKDRRAWLLDLGSGPPRLSVYPRAGVVTRSAKALGSQLDSVATAGRYGPQALTIRGRAPLGCAISPRNGRPWPIPDSGRRERPSGRETATRKAEGSAVQERPD